LPLAMQSKLLRAIQERRIRPLGSTQEELVDVRIVSATHKNLAQEVQEGRFRQDLFYRLNVIDMVIAPLRDRAEDLPDLCTALLARIAEESAIPVPELPSDILEELSRLSMPGNVRELENLLYRAVALGDGQNLHIDSSLQLLPVTAGKLTWSPVAEPKTSTVDIPVDLQSHLDTIERGILQQALTATGFNRTAAAARLGLSLRQMRYRISRLQIESPEAIGHGEESDEPG